MIKERKAVAMYEVEEILKDVKETDKNKDLKTFLKKFSETDAKKGRKLEEELKKLDIIKLKDSDIIKIIDILPDNAAELNKIVTENSLDADETNKILETVKNNK